MRSRETSKMLSQNKCIIKKITKFHRFEFTLLQMITILNFIYLVTLSQNMWNKYGQNCKEKNYLSEIGRVEKKISNM